MRRSIRSTLLGVTAALAMLSAGAFAITASGDPPGQAWGPETPNFNLEVVLRDVAGGAGFGLVKFRQPNDGGTIVYLDTWVRGLTPNHSYLLQRAVDTVLDGSCTSSAWLTLGKGPASQAITTDGSGTGRENLFRNLPSAVGTKFDIRFRVIDAVTSAAVLESGCYQFTVSM